MSKNPLCLFVCAVFMLVLTLMGAIAPSLAQSINPAPAKTAYPVQNMNEFADANGQFGDWWYGSGPMGGTAPPFGNQPQDAFGSSSPQAQCNMVPGGPSPELEKKNTETCNNQGQTTGFDGKGNRSEPGVIPGVFWLWQFIRQSLVEGFLNQDKRFGEAAAWQATDKNGENRDQFGAGGNAVHVAKTAKENDLQPDAKNHGQTANNQAAGGCAGGSAGECSKEGLNADLEMASNYLHNVANEATGAPCSSRQPVKSYNNAIWMVQQMYKQCYIPMAILFLLPGAIITNTKTLVAFGILNVKDEDTVNPFSGIMRSVIAVFLIPATQLFVSYVIDTANALTYPVTQEVNIPLILFWAFEQTQCFSQDQQGGMIKNLPIAPNVPYRGKLASMPTSGGLLEQMSGCDITLLQCFNEIMHLMTEGLSIISAFQVVFMCYLFLLGPIAAAFFAWPAGVGRDLFRKAFATWMDGVVILALWKFWWNIVLLCITVRLESEGINIFDIREVYFCIAFMAMLLFVPFNPFDFKAGEIVSHLLEKAQQQAGKVASGGGGKGGGSPGAGGAQGQGARAPMGGQTAHQGG